MDKKVLGNIISRLDKLERAVFNKKTVNLAYTPKTKTLPEIIHGREFASGQEKIAVIVGYYEKIAQTKSIKEADLRGGWKAGKFDGKYNPNFLARAVKAGWVRKIDGNLDLSQSGEDIFASFLKNEHTKATS